MKSSVTHYKIAERLLERAEEKANGGYDGATEYASVLAQIAQVHATLATTDMREDSRG